MRPAKSSLDPGPGAGAANSGPGVVALVFTDVVDSTRMLSDLGDDAAEELRRAHFSLLRQAVADTGGEEVKTLGDGLMVAYRSPLDALRCAVAMQRAVSRHNREQPDRTFHVRVGIHAGEPVQEEGDFFGTAVVVAKRLCDQAQGGQIIAGEIIAGLVGSRGAFRFRPLGRLELKGLPLPLSAVAVDWTDSTSDASKASAPRPHKPRRVSSPGPSLAGREPELAHLEAELARAAEGEFRCVLIVGDPGVGKSRLAGELLARHGADTTGLLARGYPLGATVPFGLWAEALDPVLQGMRDEEVAQIADGFLDDLAGLLHRVAAARGSVPGAVPSRLRVLEGLAGMLGNLAARRPLVVVLDDVQLADASSWEALRYVARHWSGARLLVVATSRPAELASHEVAPHVLFELDQDGLLSRLDLGPLEAHGVRDLVEAEIGRPPPAVLVQWLMERSQGNALFAVGLLRALLEEHADLAAPRLERLPEGLAERVTIRARGFGEPLRATLELLAVAGRAVTIGTLVTMTGRPLEEMGPDLAELVGSRAVIEEERGRDLTYAISHPLIRDILYQEIGGVRRRVLHRQAGRALRDAGRLAEAALHFARSAEAGDPEAIETLLEAVRQAEEREAYREALELLAELVDLLPSGDRRWLDVFDAMSWRAEWVVDHRADTQVLVGIKAMRAIGALLESSPETAGRRGVVKFRLANFLAWGTGELAEAEQACREAVQLFAEAGDERQTLLATRELAWIRGLRGDFAGMETEAARVADAADPVHGRFVVMQGLAALAHAADYRGRFSESGAALHRAMAMAREDQKSYRLTALLNQLAFSSAMQGRASEALPMFDEAKALNPAWRDSILVEIETFVHWVAGDFKGAMASAREAVAWNPGETSRRRTLGMAAGALSAVELGEITEAERFLARASRALGDQDWSVFTQYTRYGEALIAWHQDRVADCLTTLGEIGSRLLEMDARACCAFVLTDLAEAAGESGRPEVAAAAAEDLERLSADIACDLHRGLAATGRGWAAVAASDPSGGAESARRAVALLSGTDCRAHLGRACYLLGRSLSGNDRPEAVSALEQAVAHFDAGGAAWRKGRALEALRRLGSSGRRAAAAVLGPESLTRREREVARLAAQGLSAKEIAERLFVGERTVESHLSSVYAKLGVESKLDLVRRASELAL